MSETELIARMRKASTAIYLATDAAVADDISAMLRQASNALEHSGADSSDWEQAETKIERILDDAGYDVLEPWRSDVVRLWAEWDRARESTNSMVSRISLCPPLPPGEDETCTHTPTCPTQPNEPETA